MTTQILTTDHLILLPRSTGDSANRDGGGNIEVHPDDGNIFLGFSFALLFNVILAMLGAGAWELWRHIR
jgi:hypothetical protein